MILATPLKMAHEAGPATPVVNPRPFISSAAAANLRALLKQASDKSAAGAKTEAIAALRQFNTAVNAQITPSVGARPFEVISDKAAERAALTSAGQALMDDLQGKPVETKMAGLTSMRRVRFQRLPNPGCLNVRTSSTGSRSRQSGSGTK